jgi:NADH-quinone oxidoreductase subunit A
MLFDLASVLVFLLVGALTIWALLFVSSLLQRRRPGELKLSTYECGSPVMGPAWIQFNIRFYVIALIFLVFDVEIALIYPCAAVFREWVSNGVGGIAFAEIGAFLLILGVGLAYVWVRGDLNWLKAVEERPAGADEIALRRAAGGA